MTQLLHRWLWCSHLRLTWTRELQETVGDARAGLLPNQVMAPFPLLPTPNPARFQRLTSVATGQVLALAAAHAPGGALTVPPDFANALSAAAGLAVVPAPVLSRAWVDAKVSALQAARALFSPHGSTGPLKYGAVPAVALLTLPAAARLVRAPVLGLGDVAHLAPPALSVEDAAAAMPRDAAVDLVLSCLGDCEPDLSQAWLPPLRDAGGPSGFSSRTPKAVLAAGVQVLIAAGAVCEQDLRPVHTYDPGGEHPGAGFTDLVRAVAAAMAAAQGARAAAAAVAPQPQPPPGPWAAATSTALFSSLRGTLTHLAPRPPLWTRALSRTTPQALVTAALVALDTAGVVNVRAVAALQRFGFQAPVTPVATAVPGVLAAVERARGDWSSPGRGQGPRAGAAGRRVPAPDPLARQLHPEVLYDGATMVFMLSSPRATPTAAGATAAAASAAGAGGGGGGGSSGGGGKGGAQRTPGRAKNMSGAALPITTEPGSFSPWCGVHTLSALPRDPGGAATGAAPGDPPVVGCDPGAHSLAWSNGVVATKSTLRLKAAQPRVPPVLVAAATALSTLSQGG
jgi:uncharacterized membrane protein YgcG